MDKSPKKPRADALKTLQESLASIKQPPYGETFKATVVTMTSISGALVASGQNVFVIGAQRVPHADPDQPDSAYLSYFVEALVALGRMSKDEALVALAQLNRQRSARFRANELRDLKDHAKRFGFDIVKKPAKKRL